MKKVLLTSVTQAFADEIWKAINTLTFAHVKKPEQNEIVSDPNTGFLLLQDLALVKKNLRSNC